MAERRKLSLGNVSDRAEGRSAGDAARSWTVSSKRAEELKQQARFMRRNPTPAQRALWERLKDKQCGFTFNREVVMGSAIVDFACKTRWLVVETGGEGEAGATLAALSDRKLSDVGVRVLRFSDDKVLGDIETVVKAIKDELQKPFERPRIEAAR
jgi:very-short-patch-repair endonuclease